MFASSGQVETTGSGTIIALNGAVTLNIPTSASVGFQITGTWVATLIFEASVDGTNFFTVPATTLPGGSSVTTTAVNGAFVAGVGGFQIFRIRASAFTSGTVTASLTADNTPNISSTVQQGNAPWQEKIVGGTDSTIIGNISDRLKVDTTLSSITGAVTASFSSKTRVDLVTTPVNLVTGSYTSVYSYTGSGYLIGLSAEFNNAAILFRLQVDGENIVTAVSITTLGGFQATSNTTDRRMNGQGIIVNGANIDVSFRQPIRFTSSIIIAADANGGILLSRQLTQALVYIIKET